MPIITKNWTRAPGAGGLPVWTCSGVMTWNSACMLALEQYMVPTEKAKLVPLPNSRELAVARIDGADVTLLTITPTPDNVTPPMLITDCVCLGPAQIEMVAPKQTSGPYSGFAICSYSIRYQQTKDNDVTP